VTCFPGLSAQTKFEGERLTVVAFPGIPVFALLHLEPGREAEIRPNLKNNGQYLMVNIIS
jgi:hypothetical protein